jgi:hypothetical protein
MRLWMVQVKEAGRRRISRTDLQIAAAPPTVEAPISSKRPNTLDQIRTHESIYGCFRSLKSHGQMRACRPSEIKDRREMDRVPTTYVLLLFLQSPTAWHSLNPWSYAHRAASHNSRGIEWRALTWFDGASRALRNSWSAGGARARISAAM